MLYRRQSECWSCSRYYRGIRAVLLSVLLFISSAAVPAAVSFAVVNAPEPLPIGDASSPAPELTAEAAALYSADLGRTVYSKNGERRLSPYSTTKLLTCYLALEYLDLDETVTVSEEAAAGYENGTSIFLHAGEEISVRDLIYGALLASGNDAAYALGEAVSGSEAAFARRMNAQAREWGCTDTHFINANGWKSDDHYTTADDMCIITAKCLTNSMLAEMSWTEEYTIPATNMSAERELVNFTRHSLRKASGITGGKTGSWSEEDCSLVLGFNKDGVSSVLVLLGDTKKARAKDAVKLMNFAPAVTPGFLVSSKGDTVAETKVRHGEVTSLKLCVGGDTKAYPRSGNAEDIEIRTRIRVLEAPVSKGDYAGTYRVYVDGRLIAEQELLAAENIETGWLPSYLYISNRETLTGLAAIAGAVIAGLMIRALRARRRS